MIGLFHEIDPLFVISLVAAGFSLRFCTGWKACATDLILVYLTGSQAELGNENLGGLSLLLTAHCSPLTVLT
jgi:hypothetical protein